MNEDAPAVAALYPLPVTIAFLAAVALVVLVDVVATRERAAPAAREDRISVDLRRRS